MDATALVALLGSAASALGSPHLIFAWIFDLPPACPKLGLLCAGAAPWKLGRAEAVTLQPLPPALYTVPNPK